MISDKSYELYEAISNADERRVFKHWHASSIADCPRTHYFKRLGIPPLNKAKAGKILRWGAGHHMETAMRPHIDKVWGGVSSNVRLTSKKLDLTGEYDNLTLDGKTLVEDKSVHSYAFKEQDSKLGLKEKLGEKNGRNVWGIKDTPYLAHELQNHAYVLLLKEEGTEVEFIDYVYMSLDGRLVTYHTEVQEELLENVKRRLKVLNDAWKTKTPPECICYPQHPLYDSVMQWCDYKEENECCSLNLLKEKK